MSAPAGGRLPTTGGPSGPPDTVQTELTTPIDQGVMLFDSARDQAFPIDSRLQITEAKNVIAGAAGTISFWLDPQWPPGDGTNATLVQLGGADSKDNNFAISKNGQSLHLRFADNTGSTTDIGAAIDSWQPGQQHLVTAAWGQGQVFFYVDGQLAGQQPYAGTLEVQPGVSFSIGSALPNAEPVAGQLTDFRIYKKALVAGDVADQAKSPPPARG